MLQIFLKIIFILVTTFGIFTIPASSRDLKELELDTFVNAAMKSFKIPGVAIGVIKNNKIQHLKGYGVKNINRSELIDADTMYSIASNTKAFTASALAILVDDEIINWDDKVIDYLPNFRMMDPWITAEFTIRDLLTHRSGLGLGAGDLMFWPSTGVTREEIVKNVRYLKMVSGFRAKYAYDNTLYVVAGEVIASASNMSFENFVQIRIMDQLAISNGCKADITKISNNDNIASPHVNLDGELMVVGRLNEPGKPMVIAAAGGIQCSARAMMKWVNIHLNDGAGLISKTQHNEMLSPQTIIPVSKTDNKWHGTNFSAYGLGFRLKDYHGFKHVSHTGGLLGMVTYVVMIPGQNLGIVVLTNQENSYAMRAIMENILQIYLDTGNINWIDRFAKIQTRSLAQATKKVAEELENKETKPLLRLEDYTGLYRDKWFGDVDITLIDGELYFTAQKSLKLQGSLSPIRFNTFKVSWTDRSFNADAFAMFSTDFYGNVNGLKMKAISPLTDFSYDFHDLDFIKITKN